MKFRHICIGYKYCYISSYSHNFLYFTKFIYSFLSIMDGLMCICSLGLIEPRFKDIIVHYDLHKMLK